MNFVVLASFFFLNLQFVAIHFIILNKYSLSYPILYSRFFLKTTPKIV